jgi:hypothetical protein
MYRIPSPRKASVECPHCNTLHVDVPVEYDEDGGYVDLDAEHCNADNCTVKLCSSCPQFVCSCCGLKHCLEHLTKSDDLSLCPLCVGKPEPECECRNVTGRWDLEETWDASGCPLHGVGVAR